MLEHLNMTCLENKENIKYTGPMFMKIFWSRVRSVLSFKMNNLMKNELFPIIWSRKIDVLYPLTW